MRLSECFSPDTILLGVDCTDKWTLLRCLVSKIANSPVFRGQSNLTEITLQEAIIHHEEERSSGVGHGLAFSHARLPNFDGLVLGLAISKCPVDFESIDDEPVWAVFMILAPLDRPTLALKMMSRLAVQFADSRERALLLEAHDPQAIYERIAARLDVVDSPILARDMMRPPFLRILPDTPLRAVARGMLQHHVDSVGVVLEDDTLVGEITADHVFQLGMPDFLMQLKSVSFIRQFDPLEEYFKKEAHATAKDVMSTAFGALPEEATLLEVLFELAVRGRPKVHVVRDGKRVGVIDRERVMVQVLHV